MGRTRFYLNKLFGQPSVFDFHLLGEQIRLDIASTRDIKRTRSVDAEHEWIELMRNTLSSGDTVFDVGSGFGLISVLLAKHENGLDSTVHCFDADRDRIEQLDRNIEHNQLLGQLHAHWIRLGSDAVEDSIDDCNESPVQVPDQAPDQAPVQTPVQAPVQTMESFVESHRVAPDVIVVDVNGDEASVLEGMGALIGSGAPREIFLSVGTDTSGTMSDGETELETWLIDRDYALAWSATHDSRTQYHFQLTVQS